MQSHWSLEEFEQLNPPQKGQRRSRLDVLTELNAFPKSIVCKAAANLERRETPHVVAFFQLPYPIFTGTECFRLPTQKDNIFVEYEFTPFRVDIDHSGNTQITPDDGAPNFSANSTQVVAFVPLWSKHAQYFARYVGCFSGLGLRNDVIILPEENLSQSGPVRVEDFESEICRRIVRELVYSCKRFLIAYSTQMRQDFVHEDRLYNYFVMPIPGRIAWASPPTPLLSHIVKDYPCFVREPVDIRALTDAFSYMHRRHSRFEKQIFAAKDLNKSGYHALALVSAVALIEWMLKLNAPRGAKGWKFQKLIDYFGSGTISPPLRESLHRLRSLRNDMVHLRKYSDLNGIEAHAILELDIDREIGATAAEEAINLAWTFFQESNAGHLGPSE